MSLLIKTGSHTSFVFRVVSRKWATQFSQATQWHTYNVFFNQIITKNTHSYKIIRSNHFGIFSLCHRTFERATCLLGLKNLSEKCVLTFHHGDGVLYLRFEQVDPHHCSQVLHIHLIHTGMLLHLKQKPAQQRDTVSPVGHMWVCVSTGQNSTWLMFKHIPCAVT